MPLSIPNAKITSGLSGPTWNCLLPPIGALGYLLFCFTVSNSVDPATNPASAGWTSVGGASEVSGIGTAIGAAYKFADAGDLNNANLRVPTPFGFGGGSPQGAALIGVVPRVIAVDDYATNSFSTSVGPQASSPVDAVARDSFLMGLWASSSSVTTSWSPGGLENLLLDLPFNSGGSHIEMALISQSVSVPGTYTIQPSVSPANSGVNALFVLSAESYTSRMIARQDARLELVHPELGNGLLFRPTVAVRGSVAYRSMRYALDLNEATLDGGILTQDWDLAAAVRATGLFTEERL